MTPPTNHDLAEQAAKEISEMIRVHYYGVNVIPYNMTGTILKALSTACKSRDEALEFYADEKTYRYVFAEPEGYFPIEKDQGSKARAAIKEGK